MKLYIKSIIAMAALLLTTSAVARGTDEKFVISYQNDGVDCNEGVAGTVVGSVSGTTATLTVTPVDGYYITKDQITVTKLVSGDNAQTRTPGGVDVPVEITATNANADPSGVTTYTFDASDANYRYEVKANFLSRKDISDAQIILTENEFEYKGGEAIEPEISVTYNGVDLTADKEYTVSYSNNNNAGQGVVTITGVGMYKGTLSEEFTIGKASVEIRFETAAGAEATELETTFGTTFTEPVLKLNPAGAIEVTYSVNDESVATINPSTGKLTILKPGTVVVTAAAKENYTNKEGSNYEADPTSTQASYSLTINKATPTLAFSKETATATMGQAFTAPTLNNPNSLAVTYSSSKETVATISEEGVVTLVGEGETVIKATFAGNDTYEAAEASYTLTVSKDKATLAYSTQTATATMGQAFTAPTLNNPNSLAVTYSSSKETVATISEEGVVTLVGEGETTIKATFAGNETYEAAEASYTLTVSKNKATLAFSAQTATATMGQAFTAPTLNNPNSLAVTYSSSKETVATISEEGVVTLVGEGETTIKATFAGNETYEAAEASYTLTVSKDKATLAYSTQTATATMGQAFTAPTLSNPNNLAVTYSSSKETVATISEEGVVTLVGEGETTIKATFAGNDKYEPAEASYTLTVSKDKATLAYSTQTATATMGQAFTAPTLSNPNNLAVTYSSSKETVATISEEGVVTIVGEGETTIKATFAGNDKYEPAEASYTLTVSKDKATLAYSTQTATATMGQAFTAPTLSNPNNLAVTYSSSKETVATISEEGVVTIVGEGETTIKATFAGNDKYEPAEASYKLTVSSKATMEVTATGYEGVYDGNANGITVTAPEGATVKYGTEEGKYDLTESPAYTDAGTYTVYYQVTKEDTETVTGSAKVTITKGSATLKFSAEKATATMGTTFVAPTLTVTPEGLQGVKYTSSNTDVATVNETTGAVTLVAAGETTIKASFAGNDNYEAAEAGYTLTVNRARSEGYGLWINDIQVTEDNYFDVLSNSTDKKSGTIVFNPETNTLVMTNDVSNVEIESRLESLTLHINDVNKVKSIRFNNLGDATKTGKLTITTNGNFPGQIIITNDAGVSAISGFSELTRNMGLQFLEPELVELKNGVLYKYDWKLEDPANPESKKVKDDTTEKLCDAVTIGAVITPLTRNVTVTLTKASDFVAKDANNNPILDENGNPKPASMMNFALNKDILFTIWSELDERNFINGVDGDWQDAGLDDSDGDPGIAVVKTMKDEDVKKIATAVLASEYLPGGTTYSMEFDGITFIVPAGSGEIDVWVKTDPGYVYKLLPVGLKETFTLDYSSSTIKEYQELGNGKVKVTVEYNNLPTQTYYMLYLAEKSANGTRGGTRLGKRDKAHGKLYSVGVRPRSITEVNPPSEASGGVIDEEEDPEGVIDTPTPPTPPTAIKTVASESSANSGKWFTADGRQLEGKPTKPGFYIRNGKKIVIK